MLMVACDHSDYSPLLEGWQRSRRGVLANWLTPEKRNAPRQCRGRTCPSRARLAMRHRR